MNCLASLKRRSREAVLLRPPPFDFLPAPCRACLFAFERQTNGKCARMRASKYKIQARQDKTSETRRRGCGARLRRASRYESLIDLNSAELSKCTGTDSGTGIQVLGRQEIGNNHHLTHVLNALIIAAIFACKLRLAALPLHSAFCSALARNRGVLGPASAFGPRPVLVPPIQTHSGLGPENAVRQSMQMLPRLGWCM